jgi:DNA-binding transcriptional MerR regulator
MSDAPSSRQLTQAARRERAAARRLWRRDLLERAAAGESRQALANDKGVSLATVRRALARARAERPLETSGEFLAVQRERLENAVALAEARIAQGDLAAAYALIQLLPMLETLFDKQSALAAHARTFPGGGSGLDA